jgi:AraC-like DNA-binding protein
MQRELRERRESSDEAASAHLILLLIDVSRLATDVAGHLRTRGEPLLAALFEVIDEQYADGISLADIAAWLGLTPGYLTTLVRRKTGRTVQQWINERRMIQARELLIETDLTVEAIATQAGFGNASYFIKQFKRSHGIAPAGWRQSKRQPA